MEKGKSGFWVIVLIVVIVVIVIGGALYYFQNINEAGVVNVQKSLVEYYKIRDQFLNSDMIDSPETLGWQEIATVAVDCPVNADGPCGFDLLILSLEPLNEGQQEFYLAQAGGVRYSYYGPFFDDLTRLVNEANTIGSLKESY